MFVRYVDSVTLQRIDDTVGICDHRLSCGYHKTPKQYFNETGINPIENNTLRGTAPLSNKFKKTRVQFLEKALIQPSLEAWDKNNFSEWLISLYGFDIAKEVCKKYYVGSSRHWKDSTIFWQVDIKGNVRQCKIMLYSKNGKRVKAGSTVMPWNSFSKEYVSERAKTDCVRVYGKYLTDETKELNLLPCFFGEHLLADDKDKKVGIVESEKTAIIASLFYPEHIWLATGGFHGCKWTEPKVCKVLENRDVVLFPDLSVGDKCYKLWDKKAEEIRGKIKVRIFVSNIIKQLSIEDNLQSGADIADYLYCKELPTQEKTL